MGGGRKPLTIGAFCLFFVALLVFGHLTSPIAFQIVAPILGIGAYVYSPLLIALIAERGGMENAGATAGVANASWQFGGVLAPLAVGAVFQATSSFELAFTTLAAGPLLGIVCMWFIVEDKARASN
jgi:nitrate/nitrite transporter NarK